VITILVASACSSAAKIRLIVCTGLPEMMASRDPALVWRARRR
jgi:hypothetical protein